MRRAVGILRLPGLVPLAAAVGLVAFLALALLVPRTIEWGAVSLVAVFGVLVLMVAFFGRRTTSALHVTIIASLAALATAGRVLFASIPNFQPCTFLVMVSGIALGPGSGFMVGTTSALVSNFFFGQGPWTPWQMIGWGMVGVVGGLMGRSRRLSGRPAMVVVGALLSVLFDWFVTLHMFIMFTAHTWQALVALYVSGSGFDAVHAFSTGLFAALFGPQAVAILERFKRRMDVEFVSVEGAS